VALQAWAAQGGWQVQDGADPIVAEETRYFLEMAAELGPFEIGFVLSRPAGEGTTRLVQFWQQNGTEGPRVLAAASAQRFERAAGVLTPALADSLTRQLTASPRQLAA